jgi:hypothetical protein
MKKNFKVKSKNRKVLESFIDYCILHPEERFFQALSNYIGKTIRANDDDTFYWIGKEK